MEDTFVAVPAGKAEKKSLLFSFFLWFDRWENRLTAATPHLTKNLLWPLFTTVDTALEAAYQIIFAKPTHMPRRAKTLKDRIMSMAGFAVLAYNLPVLAVMIGYDGLLHSVVIPEWVRIVTAGLIYLLYYPSHLEESLFSMKRRNITVSQRAIDGALGVYVMAVFIAAINTHILH